MFSLSRQIGEIRTSTDPALKAIKDLGLNFEDLRRMNPQEQMETVARALAGMADPTKQAAAGAALLGQAYRQLAPALMEIAKGQSQINAGLTKEQIKLIADASNEWTKFANTLKFQVISALASVKKDIQEIIELAQTNFPRIFGGGITRPEARPGTEPTRFPGAPAAVAPVVFEDVQRRSDSVTKSLQAQIVNLRAQAMELEKGAVAARMYEIEQDAITKNGGALTASQQQQLVVLRDLITKQEELKEATGRTAQLYQQSAASVANFTTELAKQQTSIVEIADKLRLQGADLGIDALESLKDQLIDAIGSMEDLGTATDDTRQTFYQLLKLIGELQSSAAFRQGIPEMVRSVELELERLQIRLGNLLPAKRAQDVTKNFEQMFDSVSRAMSTTFAGIMQGTQTVGEGFRRMAQNILLSLTEVIIQLGVLNPLYNALFQGTANYVPRDTLGPIFSVIGEFFAGWFQSGGIVPGPLGTPRLAVVHGGEQITPVGGGGRPTVTINGDIIPRQPNLTKDQVVQIGMEQFGERGLWMNTLEQRTSLKR